MRVRPSGGEPEPLLRGPLQRLLQRHRDALQEPPGGAGVQQHRRQPGGGVGERAPAARPGLGGGSGRPGRAAAAGLAHLHHVQGETKAVASAAAAAASASSSSPLSLGLFSPQLGFFKRVRPPQEDCTEKEQLQPEENGNTDA